VAFSARPLVSIGPSPENGYGCEEKEIAGSTGGHPFSRELVPVMVDQLQLAHKVAHAARAVHMPRRSFVGEFGEAKQRGEVKPGKYLVPCDHPMNRAAFAVLDTGLNALCVLAWYARRLSYVRHDLSRLAVFPSHPAAAGRYQPLKPFAIRCKGAGAKPKRRAADPRTSGATDCAPALSNANLPLRIKRVQASAAAAS
jgi:hypothetical protein